MTISSLDEAILRLLPTDRDLESWMSDAVVAGAYHCDIAHIGCIAWHSVAKLDAADDIFILLR
jgi:hypothetical protein